jgi:hypothetical protein
MARYAASWKSITPTATADATNLVDSTYPLILQGGSATMRLNVSEVYMGGEAPSASSPCIMVLARDSTVAATVTAGTTRNAALDGSGTAPGTLATVGHIATTKPQRSATLHLLDLSFNAYGGIVRWVARPGEEPSVVGNTASLGEMSLSAFTGGTTGAMSGHVIYEEA